MPSAIIDFTARLNQRRQNEALKERAVAVGWKIDRGISTQNSDVCFYIIDRVEPSVLLFGCRKESIPLSGSPEIVHWGHFVLAWDVIADARMSYDEQHKKNTMELVLRALPSLSEWREFQKRAFSIAAGKKAHILVVVDRNNLEAPLELIVAHSESQVMNAESIQSIVENYTKSL